MGERVIRTKEQIQFDIESGSRVCRRCGERKSFSEYSRDNRSPDNSTKVCRDCIAFLRKVKRRRRSNDVLEKDIEYQSKVCVVCRNRKSFSRFYNSKKSRDGKSYRCIECDLKAREGYKARNKEKVSVLNRLKQVQFRYNLSESSLRAMLDEQRGCCLICNQSLLDFNTSKSHYSIDHNHNTKEVRGLLCLHCNAMLGQAKDSPSILQKGIDYLLEKGYYGDK